MANQSRKTGAEFLGGDQSAENLRRRYIETPLDAAQQPAIRTIFELGHLLSLLPDAVLASQRRELERLKASGLEEDHRIEMVQAAIEQTEVLRTTAQRGQVRVKRAFAAMADSDIVFHGFVCDPELKPLPGLTVRLTGDKRTRLKTLSATTGEDGYFRIVLGTMKSAPPGPGEKAGSPPLSQKLVNLMSGPSQETTSEAAGAPAGGGRVEIVQRSAVLHTDPHPVSLDQGSVYREYIIIDTEAAPATGGGGLASLSTSKIRS